jgi:hypothetical protein
MGQYLLDIVGRQIDKIRLAKAPYAQTSLKADIGGKGQRAFARRYKQGSAYPDFRDREIPTPLSHNL